MGFALLDIIYYTTGRIFRKPSLANEHHWQSLPLEQTLI